MEMHELWHWTRSFHEHLTVDLFVPPLSLHMLRHVGFDATGLEMQKLQPHYICLKDTTCTFKPAFCVAGELGIFLEAKLIEETSLVGSQGMYSCWQVFLVFAERYEGFCLTPLT